MTDHPAAAPARDTITLELSDLSLANAEAILIYRVLQETGWNLNRAASRLEIARGTLYSKIKKHSIRRHAMPASP
ncbi:MAG: helix-turn-helix domain-containing protein [Thermodesulfobacteriota bacterium]|nr:helix-turn-helix domain-containing protein [Thermodesulfobacteriota bacterium]